MKVYHAYRTTETTAFEFIGAYPDCDSEYEVLKQLKREGKWNRRHYFMVDHFNPIKEKGPEAFAIGEGMLSEALFGPGDSSVVDAVATSLSAGLLP